MTEGVGVNGMTQGGGVGKEAMRARWRGQEVRQLVPRETLETGRQKPRLHHKQRHRQGKEATEPGREGAVGMPSSSSFGSLGWAESRLQVADSLPTLGICSPNV